MFCFATLLFNNISMNKVFKNADEAAMLVRDMMTPAEISEFSNRLEIARLLKNGEKSYLEIAKEVGTSTTTVTRVAHWLFRGCGGYWTVLKRLFDSHEK
jgi:TrpR-related protein YerC/YecD